MENYRSFDLAEIGHEMVRASKFEQMYYELLEKYEVLQEDYMAYIQGERRHHQDMMGGLLKLALTQGEDKQ